MIWSRASPKNLGGEAYYLNAPYLCQTAEMAKSLLETKSIRETISVGKKTDVALLGIGTTSPEYSSFYLAGYVTRRELDDLRKAGGSAMCVGCTSILTVNLPAMIFASDWFRSAGQTC
jgi:DNA-binding transcriptional regulator LsrR (DeoR family)